MESGPSNGLTKLKVRINARKRLKRAGVIESILGCNLGHNVFGAQVILHHKTVRI